MTGVRGGIRVAALAVALLDPGAAPARASDPTSDPIVSAARPAAPANLSPEALRLLEREAAEAARAEDWVDVLAHLNEIHRRAPARYADGRFEFLAARALAGLGRIDEALVRFERFSSPGDLFDVPSRLAAARLRFGKGNGSEALDLLLPLLQRKEGAISRRALRTALDALETRFDAAALARLVAARPQTPPRERRRLQALRAEALEREGATGEAAALRLSLLAEGRRDDAAAALLFARAAVSTGDVQTAQRLVASARQAGADEAALAPLDAALVALTGARGEQGTIAMQRRIDRGAAQPRAARERRSSTPSVSGRCSSITINDGWKAS